jgi:hypothetical protein
MVPIKICNHIWNNPCRIYNSHVLSANNDLTSFLPSLYIYIQKQRYIFLLKTFILQSPKLTLYNHSQLIKPPFRNPQNKSYDYHPPLAAAASSPNQVNSPHLPSVLYTLRKISRNWNISKINDHNKKLSILKFPR